MRLFLPVMLSLAASAVAATIERVDLPPSLGAIATPGQPAAAQSRALYLKLIGDMRDAGKAHAALAHLDAFDRQYPRRPEATLLRADCLVDIGDTSRAATLYRLLLKGSEAEAAHAGLGRIEGLSDRWAGAADEFARAVGLAPTDVGFLNDYGFALLRAGRPADALFRLRQASELAPDNPKVRNNLILALAATGNDTDARRLLAAIPTPGERGEIEAAMVAAKATGTP